ncbi:metal-dependent hydrolase [Halomonas getboli]|uniref:metal-dependent hydrolase n=1 Tax=Halomonas getboli TaxID=2935862 RepID=UPI0020000BE1|nr:metal-dependent hydrolase [Halomonas getboli]MCK2185288.1 metal-dependent hydrolase [Halomonas getboli]
MADFRTHLGVAATLGAVVAHGGWQAGLWAFAEGLPVLALITFGGILPDIDADRSKAIRLIFNLLAIPAVVAGALWLQGRLDPGPLMVACGGIYLGVRYLGGALFCRFTVHRGIWHSLLAAALCGLTVTALSHHLFALPDRLAWIYGGALSMGFVIHLLLDEMYSVDLTGARLKRSFGTALKPFDWRQPGNSLAMLAVIVSLSPWLPPWRPLVDLVAQGSAFWR